MRCSNLSHLVISNDLYIFDQTCLYGRVKREHRLALASVAFPMHFLFALLNLLWDSGKIWEVKAVINWKYWVLSWIMDLAPK